MKKKAYLSKASIIFLLFAVSPMMVLGANSPVTYAAKSPVDKLNLRLRHQMAQIQKETKLGKLTKDQSKSLKAQVEAIRKQELTFLKQDGSKVLADSQVAQLNSQLDSLSKSIPIK